MFDNIMTAKEASIKLGKNPKYIYFLWKRGSDMLPSDKHIALIGSTLLISYEGYLHLKKQINREPYHFERI